LSTAAKNSGRERNGSATIGRLATNLHSPRTPRMPRLAVQLSILHRQLPSENAAVVQGCVPFLAIDGMPMIVDTTS
jgi:hypothetical protein